MRRTDALIEANRRFQLRLQLRVINDVVVRQRLLDHRQTELIQLLQQTGIGKPIDCALTGVLRGRLVPAGEVSVMPQPPRST